MDHKKIMNDFLSLKNKSNILMKSYVFLSPMNEILLNIAILNKKFKNDKKNKKNLIKTLQDIITKTYNLNIFNLQYYLYFYNKIYDFTTFFLLKKKYFNSYKINRVNIYYFYHLIQTFLNKKKIKYINLIDSLQNENKHSKFSLLGYVYNKKWYWSGINSKNNIFNIYNLNKKLLNQILKYEYKFQYFLDILFKQIIIFNFYKNQTSIYNFGQKYNLKYLFNSEYTIDEKTLTKLIAFSLHILNHKYFFKIEKENYTFYFTIKDIIKIDSTKNNLKFQVLKSFYDSKKENKKKKEDKIISIAKKVIKSSS